MTKTKSIASNTMYMYIRMFIIMAINLYASRVILNTLGASDYGIYNVVGGIVVLFGFLNGALRQATQRFITYDLGKGDVSQLRNTFSMSLNVHIILSIIILFFAETVGLWVVYHYLVIPADRFQTAVWVFHLSVLASIISITQVPYNATINAHEDFNIYAYVSIADAILKLVVLFAISNLSGDLLLIYAVLILLINVLIAFYYRYFCIRHYSECHYTFFWDQSRFRQIFNFSSWSLIGNFADTLSDQGINVLLNMFFGPSVNAARGIAVQIKGQVANFVNNFQLASNPQIVKAYALNEFDNLVNLVLKTSKLSFFLFLILVIPLCLEMETILSLWLKNPPPYLCEFAKITLITVLLQSLGGTLQLAIQASGEIKIYSLTVSLTKLICIPIIFWGLNFGASPVYPFLVVMIVFFSVVAINIWLVKKIMEFPIGRYFSEVIAKDFLVFICSIIIPVLWITEVESSIMRVLGTIVISFVSTSISIFLVGLNKDERNWLYRRIHRII